MPELGLGKKRQTFQGRDREWLFWYDQAGMRYLTPQEQVRRERSRADREQERADRLADRLRQMGIDPDQV